MNHYYISHTHTHTHTHSFSSHTCAQIYQIWLLILLSGSSLPPACLSHSGSCQPCWPPAGPKAGNGNGFYLILIPAGPQTRQTPALSPWLCTNSVYSWRNSLPFKPSHAHTHIAIYVGIRIYMYNRQGHEIESGLKLRNIYAGTPLQKSGQPDIYS